MKLHQSGNKIIVTELNPMSDAIFTQIEIDTALESVLRASGSSLKNYTMQKTLDEMRESMRAAMTGGYIAGLKHSVEMTK